MSSFCLPSTTAFPLTALPQDIRHHIPPKPTGWTAVSEIGDRSWPSVPTPPRSPMSSSDHPRGRRGERRQWELWTSGQGSHRQQINCPWVVIKSEAPQSLFLLLTRLRNKNKSQAHRGTSPNPFALHRGHLFRFARRPSIYSFTSTRPKNCLQTAFKKRERGATKCQEAKLTTDPSSPQP